jgi:hypothetical protein
MSNDTVVQIFGGSPLAVVGRLILISILVGVVLSVLGLEPLDIVRSIERLIRSVWEMGFDALRWLWRYFLLGAVVVIPIWLVMRIGKVSQEKQSKTSSPSETNGRLA